MAEGAEAGEFAARLTELKERSGLSYGALARRLHMSTSTLHRYCNGDAVPTDYAAVERFARLCGASPGELIEVHRAWVRADAVRGRKQTPPPAARPGLTAPPTAPQGGTEQDGANGARGEPSEPGREPAEPVPGSDGTVSGSDGSGAVPGGTGSLAGGSGPVPGGSQSVGVRAGSPGRGSGGSGSTPDGPGSTRSGSDLVADRSASASDEAPFPSGRSASASDEAGGASDPSGSGDASDGALVTGRPHPARPTRGTMPRTRRRTLLTAGGAAVAVVAAVALGVRLLPSDAESAPTAHRTSAPVHTPKSAPTAADTASPSPSGKDRAHAGASASSSAPADPEQGGGSGDGGGGTAAVPLSVTTRPYAWHDPCSQHYLVDQPPDQVPPPPVEADAAGWVHALGGVASGDQYLALSVQGTGAETVVVEALHVRVVRSGAPLPWNDYTMGVGCGGNVDTRSFDVDLDAARPAAVPLADQRDFPYKVSESDPEVFYVTAHTAGHDVTWYLELEWSSGDRHGTLRLDDNGAPFHTSAGRGAGAYQYPPGATGWGPVPQNTN